MRRAAKETLANQTKGRNKKNKKNKGDEFSLSHLFYSLSLCRRVHRNSVENEHTRHANKKCSPHPRLSEPRRSRISGSPRRNRAVPRCVPLVAFRAESVEFFFSCFLWAKRKGVKFGGQMECVGSLVVYVARAEMDARWTYHRSFLSRNIFVEKICAEKEILSRLSRFAKRVSQARAREQKLWLERKKARKNLKTGLFSAFAYPFLLSQKKTNFSPNSLSLYSFKHRLQSPRCAWLKTKT